MPIARSIKKWHGGLDINLCNVSSFDFVIGQIKNCVKVRFQSKANVVNTCVLSSQYTDMQKWYKTK